MIFILTVKNEWLKGPGKLLIVFIVNYEKLWWAISAVDAAKVN